MQITAGERLLGILGYLAFFFIIPVKVKRDSMFVQFHARQGGVLFMLWLIAAVVFLFPLLFVGAESSAFNVLQVIFMGGFFLATLLYLLLMLVGIFKVSLGERYRMPVVADVALLMGL